jgi:hypothetical protein
MSLVRLIILSASQQSSAHGERVWGRLCRENGLCTEDGAVDQNASCLFALQWVEVLLWC